MHSFAALFHLYEGAHRAHINVSNLQAVQFFSVLLHAVKTYTNVNSLI